jgi:hypothetical protein
MPEPVVSKFCPSVSFAEICHLNIFRKFELVQFVPALCDTNNFVSLENSSSTLLKDNSKSLHLKFTY